MKKMLCAAMALLLVLSCVPALADEAGFSGGWQIRSDPTVTEADRALFDHAFEGFTGVTYEPLQVLAAQVVSGMNYCFLCRGKTVTLEPRVFYAQVYIYADLSGSASVMRIQELEYSAFPPEEERTADALTGFYMDQVSGRAELTILALAGKNADLSVSWANGADETVEWHMAGMYDEGSGVIAYTDCEKETVTFHDDMSYTVSVAYTDGEGCFRIDPDGSIRWDDEKEDAGKDCVFVWTPQGGE